jgi:rhodanese-related sulfurtransferase
MRTESERAAASIPIEGLKPVEVVAALDGETVLIDLRDQSDRAVADGIPGAIPATPQILTSWATGSLPDMPFALEKDRRIIVYSSDDSESRQVVEFLRDMGFGRVAYLIGGLDSWTRRHTVEPASTDATDLEEAER